jgi:serine/threonine protein kinase
MDLADRNLQQEIDMRKMNMRQFNECELENIFRSCIEVFRHIIKEKQIFHRDIKPENILFAKEGSLDLKITDFGVSKYLLA